MKAKKFLNLPSDLEDISRQSKDVVWSTDGLGEKPPGEAGDSLASSATRVSVVAIVRISDASWCPGPKLETRTGGLGGWMDDVSRWATGNDPLDYIASHLASILGIVQRPNAVMVLSPRSVGKYSTTDSSTIGMCGEEVLLPGAIHPLSLFLGETSNSGITMLNDTESLIGEYGNEKTKSQGTATR